MQKNGKFTLNEIVYEQKKKKSKKSLRKGETGKRQSYVFNMKKFRAYGREAGFSKKMNRYEFFFLK